MIQRSPIPAKIWLQADYAINVWKANGPKGYGCIAHRWGIDAQTQEEWDKMPMHHTFFDVTHPQLRLQVAMHLEHLANRGADIYMTYTVFSQPQRQNRFALPTVWLTVDSDKHTLDEYTSLGKMSFICLIGGDDSEIYEDDFDLTPNVHYKTSHGSYFDAFRLTEPISAPLQARSNAAIVAIVKENSDEPLNSCTDQAHLFRLPGSINYKPKYRNEDGNSPSVSMPEMPRIEPYPLEEIMDVLSPYLPPESAFNGIQGFHRGESFSGLTDPAYLEAVKLYEAQGGNPEYVKLLRYDHYIKKGELSDRSDVHFRMVNDLLFRLWPVLEPQQEDLTLQVVQAICEVSPLNKRIADGFGSASAIKYAENEINRQYGYLKDKLLTHDEFNDFFGEGTA